MKQRTSMVVIGSVLCWVCSIIPTFGRPPAVTAQRSDEPRLVTSLGHSRGVSILAFSPDGRYVLTGDGGQTVVIREVESGREVHRFEGGGERPFGLDAMAFSPDRRRVLIGGHDGLARLWDLFNGRELGHFEGHSWYITDVAFSSDGRFVLTASSDKTARLWETETGQELRRFKGHPSSVNIVAFSPDGHRVLTGGGENDKTVRLWDLSNGQELRRFEGHSLNITGVAFSPDGRFVLTASSDKTARLWEASSGRELQIFKGHSMEITSVVFPPDGQFVLTGSLDNTARLWEVSSGRELRRFEGQYIGAPKGVLALAISPDGRLVLTGGGDQTALLWEISSGRLLRRFARNSYAVFSVACSPDGRLLLTGMNDGTARLWDLSSGKELRSLKGHSWGWGITAVAFSPDGRRVLTGSYDKTARLWDTDSGRELRRYEGHSRGVLALAISPDGRLVLTGSADKTAQLWEAQTGRLVRRFEGHLKGISAVAFSPSGRFVLTGGWDRTARLWEVQSGREVNRFEGHSDTVSSLAFFPDERWIMTGSMDQTSRLWDTHSGLEIRRLEGHVGWIYAVAISKDGRFALTGSSDRTARLWDTRNGREVHRFVGHSHLVQTVVFSPDEHFVLTGSWDGTSRLWGTKSGRELARLISFRDDTWTVVDTDGRFDTNNLEDIRGLHWIMPDDQMRPLPVEIFMRDYYEPRLLARILAGEQFKPVRSLTALNRVQPSVAITSIEPEDNAPDRVSVNVEIGVASGEFKRAGKKFSLQTGVYDLRLFRDGQLVGHAPNINEKFMDSSIGDDGKLAMWRRTREIRVNSRTGKRTVKFENIRLPRKTGLKQVEFSAYAFNVDKVKSATARKLFKFPRPLAPRKGRVYLVTVGVNAYENAAWDLTFASNDARRIADVLSDRLCQVNDLSEQSSYQEIVTIMLLSDSRIEGGGRVVTAKSATKANLKSVLDRLADKPVDSKLFKLIPNSSKIKPARPEDLVLISFSSHGFADARGTFYFFPYDIGEGGGRTITPILLKRAISSEELSAWLRDVDAGELVMIVDACHAAATVQSQGFKPGPMGNRGLGQLSYDKGMRILTASQADNVAMESSLIQQGLLTYALIHDGLEAAQANFKPKDQRILLSEWLLYAERRVPSLYGEIKTGRLQDFGDSAHTRGVTIMQSEDGGPMQQGKPSLQRPALFDFARSHSAVVLTTIARKRQPQ